MIVPVLALSAMVTLASSWVGSTMHGDIIAYSGACPKGDTFEQGVYLADIKRNLQVTLDEHIFVFQLTWSPDGQQLAFTMHGRPGFSDLFVMNADGGHQRNLTSTSENETDPTWSPDGRRLGFMRYGQEIDYLRQFIVLDIESGSVESRPINGLKFSRPIWSKDGDKLLFSALTRRQDAQDSYDIYYLNLEADESQALTDELYDNHSPDWSPDGQQIIYISVQPDIVGHAYYLTQLSLSGVKVQLLNSAIALVDPRWSPDGTQIGVMQLEFFGDMQERRALQVTDADGSNLRQIDLPCSLYDFSWRP
jgi:Tol biopolymer transport system component